MSASIVQTYRAFAYNNAWANHRLLAACQSLSQAEFEAVRTGFFPSLQKTLNHILIIDHFYVDALEGGWLGPKAWENVVPCTTVADLRGRQSAVDQRLIGVCEGLTADNLDEVVRINRDTRVQTERRDRLLMHRFSIRSIIGDRRTPCSPKRPSEPPQLDEFFAIEEAPLRAAEFRELGWTEETVWKS